jgi:hypothetical protein
LNEDCSDECLDGECVYIECHNDNDCLDETTTSKVCQNDKLYTEYSRDVCKNRGTTNSFCDSQTSRILLSDCEFGCLDGNCLNPSSICTDSDGGIETRLEGFVTFDGETYNDECIDGKYIKEYYCSNNEVKSSIIKCAGICYSFANRCLVSSYVRRAYPSSENLSYDSSKTIEFKVYYNTLESLIYWYVNEELVSTNDLLTYDFVSGNYSVVAKVVYQGMSSVINWNVEIVVDEENLSQLPDLYIKEFNLLNHPIVNGTNFIELVIGNKGKISAHDFNFTILDNIDNIIEESNIDYLGPEDHKIYTLKLDLNNYNYCYNKDGLYIGTIDSIGTKDCYCDISLNLDLNDDVVEFDEDNNFILLKN